MFFRTGFVLLVAHGLLLAACAPKVPDIEVAAIYDFGTVRQDDLVSVEVPLRNLGTAPLTIQEVSTACGCTTAPLSSATIPPGGEAILSVECDPSHPEPTLGPAERSIYITSDDPDENDVEVKFAMEIMPP